MATRIWVGIFAVFLCCALFLPLSMDTVLPSSSTRIDLVPVPEIVMIVSALASAFGFGISVLATLRRTVWAAFARDEGVR